MEDYTVSTNSECQKDQAWEKEFPAIEPFEEILEEIAARGSIEQSQGHEYDFQELEQINPRENNIFVRYDNSKAQNQISLAGKQDTGYRPEQQGKAV